LINYTQSNKKELIKCQIETICNEEHGQSIGLPPVASLVPLGCSSQSFLLPFHRPLATKKKSSQEKWQLFFCCLRSQSPHGRFLRSSGLLHPQYRFITLRCAALHSSSIASAAPCFFSGCSFAQPSGFAPLSLCIGIRNAVADLYFFPAVTRSQPYSPEKRASRSVVAVRGRNTAWRSSVLLREKLHNPCGASGC